MKGVQIGCAVRWEPGTALDAAGVTVTGGGTGLVLDRGPDSGSWWVMPDHSADRRAYKLLAKHLEPHRSSAQKR